MRDGGVEFYLHRAFRDCIYMRILIDIRSYIRTTYAQIKQYYIHTYIAFFTYNIQPQKIHSKIHGNENEPILYFFLI